MISSWALTLIRRSKRVLISNGTECGLNMCPACGVGYPYFWQQLYKHPVAAKAGPASGIARATPDELFRNTL